MENNSATKGKWNVSFLRNNPFNNDSIYYITGKDNKRTHSIKECEANVKLIEKAVNNHTKLVDILDEVKDYFDVCDKNGIPLPLYKKVKQLLQSIEKQ